jgi:hypothetical protein
MDLYSLFVADYGLYSLFLHTTAWKVTIQSYTVSTAFRQNVNKHNHTVGHDQSCGTSKSVE